MADNQYGLEAQWQLNRLAGTLDANKRPLYDIDEAANIWAGTVDLPLVAALNYKAGLTGFDRKDFVGVCNVLAGTTGLGAPKALSLIPDALGTLGQDAVFWVDANRGGTAGQRISNLGTAGSLLDVQVGSTGSSGLTVVPGSHVYLPGVNGNYLSVPNSSSLQITGDIDIRMKLSMTDWTPSVQQYVMAKYAGAGTRSYAIRVETDGKLTLILSQDGTTIFGMTSSVATGVTDGATKWIRATYSVSLTRAFFYLSDDGTNWTQLGTNINSTATAIFASTQPLEIGSFTIGNSPMQGMVYNLQVFNGIDGTKVLDVDCAQATTTSSLFTAVTGQTVTINRSGVDSNDPRWLAAEDRSYVYVPGVASNWLSVPDANDLDITGDIDIRAQVALDDWTPSATHVIVSKVLGTQCSYELTVQTNGTLGFGWYADGATQIGKVSTVAVPVVDTAPLWIRVTLDVDNGASGNDVKFFTSVDGITWTQLGATVTTAGTTSIFASTTVVGIGQRSSGSLPSAAKIYRAQIFNGIDGTKVLDVDCSVLKSGSATSFTALTGQTVTINRSTSGRKTVVVPSRVLEKVDDKHVYLPGGAGNSLSIPHVAGQQVGDTLDVRVDVSTDSLNAAYAGKGSAISAAGLSWYFGQSGSNFPTFAVADGTNLINVATSAAPPVGVGGRVRLRATYQRDTGSGQYAIAFFFSTDFTTALKDITSWTQFGSTLTGASIGATSDLNQPMFVGTFRSTAAGAAGKYYGFSLDVNGVNTVLIESKDAPLNFTAGTANSFTAKTGQTVTMNSTAGSGMQVVDARSATGSSCWLFGTDDYLEVANRWVDGTAKNVYLPGVSGNTMTIPDAAALDITGDIDVRCRVALDDWTPASNGSLVQKATGATQYSYALGVRTDGKLSFAWSPDGTTGNAVTVLSSVGAGVADGAIKWVRATLDVDNGASGNDVKFWTSDDGSSWTQLGTTSTRAGTTSVFASTSVLQIGDVSTAGRFYRAVIYSDLTETTKVFDANMETSVTSLTQTTFTESSTNAATVTINKSGTGYVSTPIVQSGYIYPTGTSNLTPSASSLLDFGATDSFTVLTVARKWNNPSGVHHTFMAKKDSTATSASGWLLYNGNNTATLTFGFSDGTTANNWTQSLASAGSLSVVAGVRNTTADTLQPYVNGVAGSSAVDTTTGGFATVKPLRIGDTVAEATFFDGEFIAAAVFRRALSAAEIKAITEYYQRTVK